MTAPSSVAPPVRLPAGETALAFTPLLLSASILSFLVPVLLAAQVADQGRSSAWVLSVLVTVWSGLRISLLLGRGEARLFSFFFWLFTYVFLGVAPTVQIRSGQPSVTTPDVLPSMDHVALGTVLVGIACFEFGSFWGRLRRTGHATLGLEDAPKTTLSSQRAVGLWLVGMLTAVYYVYRMGLATLFSSRDAATEVRSALWPSLPLQSAILGVATYAPLISVGAITLLRHSEVRPAIKLCYSVMVGLGAVMLIVVVSPLSSARYPVGTVFFALAVFAGAVATANRVRLILAATIFGLLFIFPLADAFRRPNERDFSRAGFFSEYAGNPDYDSIWQIANAMTYWSSGRADVGGQALGVLFFFVPRSIWSSKPLDTGVLLGNVSGYTVTNLSAPLWAEAAVNGGVLAVIFTFLGAGFLVTRLDGRLMTAVITGGIWFVAGAVFAVYLVIILRGSLLQATGSVVLVSACIAVLTPVRSTTHQHPPPDG